jgi:DNA-directed RNA polymerase specialized sigma subunit
MFDDKYTYINDLVSKYQNNKDKESLFLLYDFYKPLFLSSIKRCINKDSRLSVHREDLLSECIFVLEKLINQYDPDLTYFSYFLSTRIDINLLRHITSKFIKEHEESSESIHIEASYDPFNTIDTVLSLESAIKQLPQEQTTVKVSKDRSDSKDRDDKVKQVPTQPTTQKVAQDKKDEKVEKKKSFFGDFDTTKIKDGLSTILLIATGIVAIGLALKLVGKVDILSVIALSIE